MSQPPNSPGEQQANASAFAQWQSLKDSGHFKPATSISLHSLSPASVPLLGSPIDLGPPISANTTPHATPTPPAYSPTSAYAPRPDAPTAPVHPIATYVPRSERPTTPDYPASTYAPPRAAPIPPAHAPSPYTAHPTAPQLAPTSQNNIPQSTYGPFPGAHGYASQPQILLTPDSITRDMLASRVQTLLRLALPEFNISQNVMLSMSLVSRIIHLGQNGALGPHGIQKLDEIFIVIGHDGLKKYMALAVMAPVSLCVLLKGTSEDLEGKEPLVDRKSMEWLRQGFHNVAVDEYNRLQRSMQVPARR
ncbi:hypothetical protein HBI56_090130 [Parastagonospora nodorum]|nr:hypothetical protein HBH53_065090 [Parastagonospora nodorum]KAH3979206.1 hypothetical protein HBH52_101160 [Parastagonospora nodorum]KAH3999640.1 hypothetical protein HBI10_112330 [Parastagonospora nodorum]KAH4014636.1 hypothetical protein HBI13_168660 [Parastagonospora nodorum]KAH4035059.1 hypothetical protein HBI09_094750 [Parastagonospora nodorum]